MTNKNIVMKGTSGREVKAYLGSLMAEMDDAGEYDITLQLVEHPEDP